MIAINTISFNDLHGLKMLYEDSFEGSLTDYDKMIESFNQIKENPNYINHNLVLLS